MPSPDDERLGLLYEIAVDQANVAQAAVKDLIAATDDLRQLPASLSAEVSRLLASSATDAAKPTALIAEEAAREFQTATQEAAQTARQAAQETASACNGVKLWVFLGTFAVGAFCGAAGLWVFHTPQASPIYLDSDKLAKDVAAACRRK